MVAFVIGAERLALECVGCPIVLFRPWEVKGGLVFELWWVGLIACGVMLALVAALWVFVEWNERRTVAKDNFTRDNDR